MPRTRTKLALGADTATGQIVKWDMLQAPHLRVHGKSQGSGKTLPAVSPILPAALPDLLYTLALDGWRFWLEEGRLRYRAPKTAVTGDVLEQLKQQKAAIVDLLTAAPHCLDICPLSYGQTALWFLWKLAPASYAYNQSLPLRIDGGDAAKWRAACATLVARHPLLRTIFPTRHGDPYQQVLPTADLTWREAAGGGWEGEQLAAAICMLPGRRASIR